VFGGIPEKTTVPCIPLRILLVEDELLLRWSMSEVLAESGHVVVEAANARDALHRLTVENPVDVVFLDIRLPDSHDLMLLRQIRARAPNAAIIVMTAFGTPELTAEGLSLGAHAVLDKPFDIATLEPLLSRARGAEAQWPA
jgi:DNA-binding NtrC family response regulator